MKSSFVFLSVILFGCLATSAQSTIEKTINVSVTDAATGKPIENAKVIYKGLLKKQTLITDAGGKVTFNISLFSSSQPVTIEVNDGKTFSGHEPFKRTITLIRDQEIYDVPVSLKSDTKGVMVTVRDQDNGQAISNASIIAFGANDGRDITAESDGAGNASFGIFLLDKAKDVRVKIEKAGYDPYETIIRLVDKTEQYPVRASLKKKKDVRWLDVTVVADDDGSPVIGAVVTALGSTLKDTYSGVTDQNGVARVILESGGELDISARHDAFRINHKNINVNYYGEDKEYKESLRLERKDKTAGKRFVVVYVYYKGKNGEQVPLSEASVKLGRKGTLTMGNSNVPTLNGMASIEEVGLALGDQAAVTVSHPDYETKTKSFVVGNDKWSEIPKFDQVDVILEPPKSGIIKLKVQVLDHETDKPLTDASVQLVTLSGKAVTEVVSYRQGMGNTFLEINPRDITNQSLRIVAKAPGYEEKWSDVSPEFLKKETELFTIFMKKDLLVKGEKKYGSFTVVPGQWLPTGLRIKKGQSFRVIATGKLRYKDPPNIESSPDGGGAWGWWQLKAKINEQLIGVGSKGSGTADADGLIELGAPATYRMGHGEEKALEGSYTVYIYAKDVVQDMSPANNPLAAEKLKKAKEHLAFLQSLLPGTMIPNK